MERAESKRRSRMTRATIALAVVVVTGIGGAVACAATILAATALSAPPVAALVLGIIVAAGTGWVGALRWRRSRRGGLWSVGLIVVSLATSAGVLLPIAGTPVTPHGLTLSDGTRMPVRVKEGPSDRIPVVAVHGGPGIPFTDDEERTLRDAFPGRAVITFDQVGAGGASRLAAPSGYSTTRAVADLAVIVDFAKASQVILVGYSDGAGIAAEYAAGHPGRVAALVLISPGPLIASRAPVPVYGPQSGLDIPSSIALYATALQPRNLFLYLMSRVDPDAAHAFGGDAEMDARYSELLALSARGLHCPGTTHAARTSSTRPPGHYLNQVRQNLPAVLDSRSLVSIGPVPLLVLRGTCDYIPRSVVDAIAAALPHARIAHVEGSGHALLEDRPDAVRARLGAFLADQISG